MLDIYEIPNGCTQTLLTGDNIKRCTEDFVYRASESDCNHHKTIFKLYAKRALHRSSKRKKIRTIVTSGRCIESLFLEWILVHVHMLCTHIRWNHDKIVDYFGFANVRFVIRSFYRQTNKFKCQCIGMGSYVYGCQFVSQPMLPTKFILIFNKMNLVIKNIVSRKSGRSFREKFSPLIIQDGQFQILFRFVW